MYIHTPLMQLSQSAIFSSHSLFLLNILVIYPCSCAAALLPGAAAQFSHILSSNWRSQIEQREKWVSLKRVQTPAQPVNYSSHTPKANQAHLSEQFISGAARVGCEKRPYFLFFYFLWKSAVKRDDYICKCICLFSTSEAQRVSRSCRFRSLKPGQFYFSTCRVPGNTAAPRSYFWIRAHKALYEEVHSTAGYDCSRGNIWRPGATVRFNEL